MANCNYKVKIKDIQNKYTFKIFSPPKGEKGDPGEVTQEDLDNNYYTKTEINNKTKYINYSTKFGDILTSLDKSGFSFRRNNKEIILDIENKIDTKEEVVYYVDSSGSNSNSGTEQSPYKTIAKALSMCSDTSKNYRIISSNYLLGRNEFIDEALSTFNVVTNIKIEAKDKDKIIHCIPFGSHSYTNYSGNVYYTNRSYVKNVYDRTIVDKYGQLYKLEKVDTLELCSANPNTYYIDSSNNVYINSIHGNQVNQNYCLSLKNLQNCNFTLADNCKLEMENIYFYDCVGSITGNYDSSNLNGTKLIMKKCGNFYSRSNGFSILDINKAFLINCITYKSDLDGFNYHLSTTYHPLSRQHYFVELYCESYDNGKAGDTIDNCSTCHDGCTMYRLGGTYSNSYGPVIADINSSYTVLYECNISQNYVFYTTHFQGESGVLYLININTTSSNNEDIMLSDGMTANNVYIRNYYGKTNINGNIYND